MNTNNNIQDTTYTTNIIDNVNTTNIIRQIW